MLLRITNTNTRYQQYVKSQLPRSTYYYEAKERVAVDDVTSDVIVIFQISRQNYGTRKFSTYPGVSLWLTPL